MPDKVLTISDDNQINPRALEAIAGSPQVSTAIAEGVAGVSGVPKWAPSVAYAQGAQVVNPAGQLVVATVAHTSAATYDATRWELPLARGRVLALGTSIAAGVGATGTSTAYPARIKANLNTLLGLDYSVVPAGVSGDTTAQMLARLPGLISAYAPTYVTIEVSVNDARIDRSITTDQSVANIRKMVVISRLAGATPILITSTPFDPTWFGSSSYDYTSNAKAYATNTAAKALAAELSVPVVDLYPALLGRTVVLSDGLHPNNAGHDLWGLLIASKIAAVSANDSRTVKILDEFARADSASSLGSADVGGAWAQWRGTWGIVSGGAEVTSATDSQYAAAVIDAGTSDLYAETTFVGAFGASLLLRGTDINNFYVAEIATVDKRLRVYKRINGTFTTIYTSPSGGVSVADGDKFAFSIEGSHLTYYVRDIPVNGHTDTGIASGGYAGLWNGSTTLANRARFARYKATV